MAELVGVTLKNQYTLRSLAGSGGMADVYLAWDRLRSVPMAVKVLRRDLALDRKFHDAFEKEARVLEELNHPNIVRLYEFGKEGDIVYIVMAWVDGTNLRDRISSLGEPMSPGQTALILEPLCRALNFAHQTEIFHCDIKPSNILLHQNGREVFLTDFGVAHLAHERAGGGTLPYMAPEQFTYGTVNARTDLYALGITLYEMLSGGTLPYHGDSKSPGTITRDRFAWEHNHLPLPPLVDFNPSLPRSVIDVVQKTLHKDAQQRFATTMDLWEAFKAASMDIRATVIGRATVPEPPRPPRQETPAAPPTERIKTPTVKRQPEPRGGSPYLLARSGDWAGQCIYLQRTGLTMGRGSDCQLRLSERSVSRTHASIIVTRQGVYLRDEGSSLGTKLNGRAIAPRVPVLLKPGDVIQMGYYQVFEYRTS